jgi:hypothetical protein
MLTRLMMARNGDGRRPGEKDVGGAYAQRGFLHLMDADSHIV